MPDTRIVSRQIADGAITDAKVAAGAAILSSKLAEGLEFVRRNGLVALTGTLDAGNNRIANLTTPSAAGDATNKSYVDTSIAALNSLFDSKPSAKAQATGNVPVNSPGTSTFDAVTLSNGDRLFLNNQTGPAENGPWVFNGPTVPLTRDATMSAWAMFPGALVAVEGGGATNAGRLWLCTNAPGGTLGTTAVNFTQVNAATALPTFVDEEVPAGSVNGSNTAFTLAFAPLTGSLRAYLNGQRLRVGAGNDYTFSGTTLTLAAAPLAGEYLCVEYRR